MVSQPITQPTANQPPQTDLNFLGIPQQPPSQPPLQPPLQSGLLDDFLGSSVQQHNSNSFKAFENDQIEILMECFKESADITRIITTYNNKTQSSIENLSLQVAVLKHLKLTINPLNSAIVKPLSRGEVSQVPPNLI